MEIPAELHYIPEHAYVRPTGDEDLFRCGITDFAQGELGDIVYLNLPSVGDDVTAGLPYGSIEAVKTVSELISPLTGKVAAVNPRLPDEAALVNTDPYDHGWIVEIRTPGPLDFETLLDDQGYRASIGG